jgi:hypothetical protein
VITLWVISMMIAFGLRYWHGAWKKMRVIESTTQLAEVPL